MITQSLLFILCALLGSLCSICFTTLTYGRGLRSPPGRFGCSGLFFVQPFPTTLYLLFSQAMLFWVISWLKLNTWVWISCMGSHLLSEFFFCCWITLTLEHDKFNIESNHPSPWYRLQLHHQWLLQGWGVCWGWPVFCHPTVPDLVPRAETQPTFCHWGELCRWVQGWRIQKTIKQWQSNFEVNTASYYVGSYHKED